MTRRRTRDYAETGYIAKRNKQEAQPVTRSAALRECGENAVLKKRPAAAADVPLDRRLLAVWSVVRVCVEECVDGSQASRAAGCCMKRKSTRWWGKGETRRWVRGVSTAREEEEGKEGGIREKGRRRCWRGRGDRRQHRRAGRERRRKGGDGAQRNARKYLKYIVIPLLPHRHRGSQVGNQGRGREVLAGGGEARGKMPACIRRSVP